MKKGDHLFLVDGSGFIFRAFHAIPALNRKSDGLPVNAVSGFCNMLWKLLRDARNTDVGVTPTHLAVIFDYSSTTFRKEIYPLYKANRSAPPEDLIPQFGLIRHATRAFNLPCIETEGFEADDIIATYARAAEAIGADVTITGNINASADLHIDGRIDGDILALVKNLRSLGAFKRIDHGLLVDPRRWQRDGWWKRSLLNRLLALAHACGVSAFALARLYQRNCSSQSLNP